MSKKLAAFLIALPALIFFALFKIIPVIYISIISFREGVLKSESVGLANYVELLQFDRFPVVMKNTVFISSLSILFTCILAVLLILCISRLPNWILKTLAIAFIAIPAFIPTVSYVSVFMDVFSVDGIINRVLTSSGAEPRLFFAESWVYPYLAALMDAIRSVYIPVIVGVLVCETRTRGSGAGRIFLVIIGYVAVRAMTFMSPDLESMMLTKNPLNSQAAEVIDTLSYNAGLVNMKYTLAAALWVVKTFIQLIISIVAFSVLYFLGKRITELTGQLGQGIKSVSGSVLGIVGFIVFGAASFMMIISTFLPGKDDLSENIRLLLSNEQFVMAFTNSLKYGLISCGVYGIISVTMAYPLCHSKVIYPLFLVILFSMSNNYIGEYLFAARMSNTIFPIIVSSVLSVTGAFALHFSVSCRLKGVSCSIGEYFRFALSPLIVIVTLIFISSWGSFLYQNMFVTDVSMQGIGSYVYQMVLIRRNADIRYALIFVSSAVPAALGVLLIFLNKFLPLTAFGAYVKRG